jgi:23S rRNA pseudouridine2605 synthase
MDGLVRTGVPAGRRTIMAGKSRQPQGAKSGERIAKVMARAGLCSRREAEAWIAAGRVAVNGKPIASPALDVSAHDHVTVDGEPLRQRERTRLFLFHKPRGQLTSHADARGRPTIFAALPKGLPRLISVGRLDLNTEGLLLLTNDGGLARTLELPATGWLRRYRVRAHGRVRQEELDRLHNGISIAGIRYGSIEARLEREQGANSWLTFAMREGKNREVKNVLGHLGLAVNRLIRVSYGPFQLAELGEGEVEEVKTRVLRDQLGDRITALSGADFSAPIINVPTDAEEAPARHPPERRQPPEGAPGSAARSSAKPGARAPAPAPPKRKPNRDKKRSRDAERLGGPELARRDKRRGRGPGAGKPRSR